MEKELHDTSELETTNVVHNNDKKIKWWLSMPFIWLIVLVTSFVFCIPGIILFIVRLVKYPNRRLSAIISATLPFVVLIIFGVVIAIGEQNKDKAIQNEIASGNYENAISLLNDKYSTSSFKYYSAMADVYEKQGKYDDAASFLIDFVKDTNVDSVDNEAVERLKNIKDNVSDSARKNIEDTIDIVEERAALKETAEQVSKENSNKVKASSEEQMVDGENIADGNQNTGDSEKKVVDANDSPIEIVTRFWEAQMACDEAAAVSLCDDSFKEEAVTRIELLYEEKENGRTSLMNNLLSSAQDIFNYTAEDWDIINAEYLRDDEDINKALDSLVECIYTDCLTASIPTTEESLSEENAVVKIEILEKTPKYNQSPGSGVKNYLEGAVADKLLGNSNYVKKELSKKMVKEMLINHIEDEIKAYQDGDDVALGSRTYYLIKKNGKWLITQIDREDYNTYFEYGY